MGEFEHCLDIKQLSDLEKLVEVLDLFTPMTTETTLNPQIEEGWKKVLMEEFGAEYMKELKKKLAEELKSGVILYPPPKKVFRFQNKIFAC